MTLEWWADAPQLPLGCPVPANRGQAHEFRRLAALSRRPPPHLLHRAVNIEMFRECPLFAPARHHRSSACRLVVSDECPKTFCGCEICGDTHAEMRKRRAGVGESPRLQPLVADCVVGMMDNDSSLRMHLLRPGALMVETGLRLPWSKQVLSRFGAGSGPERRAGDARIPVPSLRNGREAALLLLVEHAARLRL